MKKLLLLGLLCSSCKKEHTEVIIPAPKDTVYVIVFDGYDKDFNSTKFNSSDTVYVIEHLKPLMELPE